MGVFKPTASTQGLTGLCTAVGLLGRMAWGGREMSFIYVVPSWRSLCHSQELS